MDRIEGIKQRSKIQGNQWMEHRCGTENEFFVFFLYAERRTAEGLPQSRLSAGKTAGIGDRNIFSCESVLRLERKWANWHRSR